MVEVKGTAVVTLPEFVQQTHGAKYQDWLNSLTPQSKNIMGSKMLLSSWYSVDNALDEPLKKICDQFYGGKLDGAWESGRFSADKSLTGIYKAFVKLGTPSFIISRATSIINMYYKGLEIKVVENMKSSVVLHLTKFENPSEYVQVRIGGWMQRAIEISGCKNVNVKITKSIAKGDPVTEYCVSWS